MNNNEIARILQEPFWKERTLYSPAIGYCKLDYIIGQPDGENCAIRVHTDTSGERESFTFDGNGRLTEHGQIMLFATPDCDENDWYKINDDTPKPLRYYAGQYDVDELVERAFDCIDFDSIHQMMLGMNRKWSMKRVVRFPSIKELKARCEELLRDALSHDEETEWNVSCGGFSCGFRVYGQYNNGGDTFDERVNVYVKYVFDEFETLM